MFVFVEWTICLYIIITSAWESFLLAQFLLVNKIILKVKYLRSYSAETVCNKFHLIYYCIIIKSFCQYNIFILNYIFES